MTVEELVEEFMREGAASEDLKQKYAEKYRRHRVRDDVFIRAERHRAAAVCRSFRPRNRAQRNLLSWQFRRDGKKWQQGQNHHDAKTDR